MFAGSSSLSPEESLRRCEAVIGEWLNVGEFDREMLRLCEVAVDEGLLAAQAAFLRADSKALRLRCLKVRFALSVIRKRQLYCVLGYPTFEAYCRERLQMPRDIYIGLLSVLEEGASED